MQAAISLEDNRQFVGKTVEVLVEGQSKKTTRRDGWDDIAQLTGRTNCDRIVVFGGPDRLVGQFVKVVIEDCSAVTLFGEVETAERVASRGS